MAAGHALSHIKSLVMELQTADHAEAGIAAAIGVPARARMLYALLDGRARTSTELAVAADVMPSTASIHLGRMLERHLVKVLAQGKHRYYALDGPAVAAALEALSVIAGRPTAKPAASTVPHPLRQARSCYDHIAGALGVCIHDRLQHLRWIAATGDATSAYRVTANGARGLETLGIDLDAAQQQRRRFAFGCLDWSERRPHLGGALGAALLDTALRRRWVRRDDDSRALTVSTMGARELKHRLGVTIQEL